jgi:hypothetical protein
MLLSVVWENDEQKSEGFMRIENRVADELLVAARKGKRMQEFMDAVSGVEEYRLDDHGRQGCIRGFFAKELIKGQFLLEFDDLISIFWQGVFEKLDSAALWGEKVEIKAPGKYREYRPTQNNPIHYLRYHGFMAARNHITSLYRKNLQQGCPSCGHTTSVKNNKECKKCGQQMSTIYKFSLINDEKDQLVDENSFRFVDNKSMASYLESVINEFDEVVLGGNTRASQVLRILMDPEESRAMCAACKLCNSETFDIDSCTNYNANIGRWLGVNKTMIASKIRSIRKRFPEFLRKKNTRESRYLLQKIPSKFRAVPESS